MNKLNKLHFIKNVKILIWISIIRKKIIIIYFNTTLYQNSKISKTNNLLCNFKQKTLRIPKIKDHYHFIIKISNKSLQIMYQKLKFNSNVKIKKFLLKIRMWASQPKNPKSSNRRKSCLMITYLAPINQLVILMIILMKILTSTSNKF